MRHHYGGFFAAFLLNTNLRQRHKLFAPLSEIHFGGEGEIRTLETLAGLHDFQSCALDQLGDFSIAAQENRTIYRSLSCDSFIIITKFA